MQFGGGYFIFSKMDILYFHRLREIIIIIIILNCIEARKAFISRFGIAQDKTLYYGKSNNK